MDDDYGIPFEWPPSRPMVNYQNDRELEEDYEIDCEWFECDTVPLIAPYTGFRQCLLDLIKTKPEDFFNALFDDNLYTIMAEETNKYAHRKKQTHKYKKSFISTSYINFFRYHDDTIITYVISWIKYRTCFISINHLANTSFS